MDSSSYVTGHVHLVEETKTYGQKGFRKRLVVLEQDEGEYTNLVPVEFTRDHCDICTMEVRDEITVRYRLRGRAWQKDSDSDVKYFLNAEADAWRPIEDDHRVDAPAPAPAPAPKVSSDEIPF